MMKRSIGALAAMAAAMTAFPTAGVASRDGGSADYGSPVGHVHYDHEICLKADTTSVSVRRHDIVRFVTRDGREFSWRFDTDRPGVFPLARIAPAGVSVPSGAIVYVNPEIPIAP